LSAENTFVYLMQVLAGHFGNSDFCQQYFEIHVFVGNFGLCNLTNFIESIMSQPFFGLHIGQTNASIAVYKDGRNEVLANPSGDRVTPACVALRKNVDKRGKHEILVGLAAKQHSLRHPQASITNNLPLLDENHEHELALEEEEKVHISAEQVHTHILKYLHGEQLASRVALLTSFCLDIAKSQALEEDEEEESYPSVLTVPAFWPVEKRKAALKLAESAGFQAKQAISTSSAAILNAGLLEQGPCTALVYRCLTN